MQTTLLALLLIPIVSFAQLTSKDIKSIDTYATDMCEWLDWRATSKNG